MFALSLQTPKLFLYLHAFRKNGNGEILKRPTRADCKSAV